MKKISHSYFVVMIDHGQRGLEAIVHPEDTRRAVVEMLATGESKHVVFIHHVDGLDIDDVTKEIIEDAKLANALGAIDTLLFSPADRIAFNRDHARDLRKHGETV